MINERVITDALAVFSGEAIAEYNSTEQGSDREWEQGLMQPLTPEEAQEFGIRRGSPVALRSAATREEIRAGICDPYCFEDSVENFELAAKQLPRDWQEHILQKLRATEKEKDGLWIRSGFMRAADIPVAKEVRRLWFGMYPSSVVLFNGETGAGKSVILLTIAVHAALNKPLWRIPFTAGRPLRVLYVDPENAGAWRDGNGGITAVRLERIGLGRPEGLMFHDGKDLNLSSPAHMAMLKQLVIENAIDILILDPLIEVFDTENENDNVEAGRQMKALIQLSRETKACVILCHHTGKAGEEQGFHNGKFGRGASSRLGAADVGITLRARGKTGDVDDDDGNSGSRQRDDVVRTKIEKNRVGGEYTSIYLKMVGNDQFERVTSGAFFERGRNAANTVDKPLQARQFLDDLFRDGKDRSRQEILEAGRSHGIGRLPLEAALNALVDGKALSLARGKRGVHIYKRQPGASLQVGAPIKEVKQPAS